MIKIKPYELEQEILKSGLTQYKFSAQLNIAPSNFSEIFSGKKRPTTNFIDKLCLGTGKNFDYFFEIAEG